jgi:tannase
MRFSQSLLAIASVATTCAYAQATLAEVCTDEYVLSHLPAADFYNGITLNTANVTAVPVTNHSAASNAFYPAATFDYCSVTLTYNHDGLADNVILTYWLPAPASFQNRYLSTGGK